MGKNRLNNKKYIKNPLYENFFKRGRMQVGHKQDLFQTYNNV